jgi:hypothetical protein
VFEVTSHQQQLQQPQQQQQQLHCDEQIRCLWLLLELHVAAQQLAAWHAELLHSLLPLLLLFALLLLWSPAYCCQLLLAAVTIRPASPLQHPLLLPLLVSRLLPLLLPANHPACLRLLMLQLLR